MKEVAKLLIFLGGFSVLAGVVILAAGKISWLGHLPGDIAVRHGNARFYFPVTTCLLFSLILSLLLHLFSKR